MTRTDGTATPSGSDDAGVCSFYLEHPNPPEGSLRDVRRVEIHVEPDPDEARAAYRESRADALRDTDTRDVPELGTDAFYWPLFEEVIVLEAQTYLSVAYEAELAPDDTAGAAAAERAAIELAGFARDRLGDD